jgi:uncharacterized membrane-anchored protein YjiN (DUF445 family)
MKKSQLKEIIHKIVSRKLQEAKSTPAVYGYVMKDPSNTDPNDPTLQLIGYGNMPKSLWKKKIERYAEELLKRVKNEDWKNAAYFLEKNGVFNSSVNMMKEVFSEKGIKEADENPMSGVLPKDKIDSEQDTVDPRTQRDIDAAQKNIDKVTADIRKLDGMKSKLEEPVRRKLQDIERKKAALQKKQGQETKKLEDLKKA